MECEKIRVRVGSDFRYKVRMCYVDHDKDFIVLATEDERLLTDDNGRALTLEKGEI